MPQSYSSLWVHLIWSTKNREPILTPALKAEVHKVIKETANDHQIYLDCINGVEDHVHLLIRLRTDQSVADVVKTIKGNSWEYFKDNPDKSVTWQDGFAAFSVSPSHLKRVRSYIYNQEKHHRDKSFSEELKEIKRTAKSMERIVAHSDGFETHRYVRNEIILFYMQLFRYLKKLCN